MTFLALTATAGFVASACQQHPASELEGEGLANPYTPAATEGQGARPEAPKSPTSEPTNPGGSAPVQPAKESPSLFPAK